MTAAAPPLVRPALPVVVWQSVRPLSLTIALMSSVVGTMALLPAAHPIAGVAALCALLAVLLQCGTNALNDSEDARTGADDFAGAGSSLAMRRGWIGPSGARLVAVACFAVAALLGLGIVVLVHKPGLLLLGAAALAVGWAYTAWPLRLAYRPLGELASAVPMGIGITWGSAAAQTDAVPARVWWAAVPLALLTAAILHANNARDRLHDASVGKRTLATYLSPRTVVAEYQALLIAVPLVLTAGLALREVPLWLAVAMPAGLIAIHVAGTATASLTSTGWTRLLLAAVRLHLLMALSLSAGFALSLIR